MAAPKQNLKREKLAEDIRRELAGGRTARFLHAMPVFKVTAEMPDYLRQLLDRLEDCEAPARSRRR
jgi:hypothetical protein